MLISSSWILGLAAGMYVKWRSICAGCAKAIDEIILEPRSAPVVVMRGVQAKEKQWKNYRAQVTHDAPHTTAVPVLNACVQTVIY